MKTILIENLVFLSLILGGFIYQAQAHPMIYDEPGGWVRCYCDQHLAQNYPIINPEIPGYGLKGK